MTVLSALLVHRPELVLLLGDQLDEGGLPTPQRDWEVRGALRKRLFGSVAIREEERCSWHVCLLSTGVCYALQRRDDQQLPSAQDAVSRMYCGLGADAGAGATVAVVDSHVWQVGNHDTSFGRYMTPLEVARFERAFGPSNFVEYVGDHAFVGVNTMALDLDVTSVDVNAQAEECVRACVCLTSEPPTAFRLLPSLTLVLSLSALLTVHCSHSCRQLPREHRHGAAASAD